METPFTAFEMLNQSRALVVKAARLVTRSPTLDAMAFLEAALRAEENAREQFAVTVERRSVV
jgi:hypothetical protein